MIQRGYTVRHERDQQHLAPLHLPHVNTALVDNVYRSNLMFFRLNARNKKVLQGGLQIEVPLVYARFAAGGWYQGFDLLDVSPSDTVKNAAYDWKQAYTPVSVDGLTLIRADSPEAVVNFLSFYFEQAQTELAEIIGAGLWSTTNTLKQVDAIPAAVDDGTIAATYGGLSRAANTWWVANVTAIMPPLSLATMQTMFGTCTEGGRHPTLIVTTQTVYNLYWALSTGGQAFPVQPSGHDEQLAQNGFTNLLFNGVPIAVDSHVPASQMFFLNEDYIYLYVNPRADFNMKEFREPVNQDAMTSLILWAGDVCFSNVQRQGKLTGVTS